MTEDRDCFGHPREKAFIEWQLRNGQIEDMEAIKWDIGGYGFKPVIDEEPTEN